MNTGLFILGGTNHWNVLCKWTDHLSNDFQHVIHKHMQPENIGCTDVKVLNTI